LLYTFFLLLWLRLFGEEEIELSGASTIVLLDLNERVGGRGILIKEIN
jgi:hypothetical protein